MQTDLRTIKKKRKKNDQAGRLVGDATWRPSHAEWDVFGAVWSEPQPP